MKQFWRVTAIVAAALALASCVREPQLGGTDTVATGLESRDSENVEQMLVQAEREKVVDMQSGRWIERWIADDCVSTNADGSIQVNPKPVILANIRSGAWRVNTIAIDNVNVRIFGDAAVVTATQTEKSQFQGKDSGGRYQYTHFWVKRDSGWQVVATHTTRLAQSTS
jgi:hypothetical protein